MSKLKIDYKESLLNAQKYIEQLEKENLVLHKMNKKRLDLQKENAELKEKCNSLQELVTYYQTNFCQEG